MINKINNNNKILKHIDIEKIYIQAKRMQEAPDFGQAHKCGVVT